MSPTGYWVTDKSPTMHHSVTEMCKHKHISITKWCIVGDETVALRDLWDWSISNMHTEENCQIMWCSRHALNRTTEELLQVIWRLLLSDKMTALCIVIYFHNFWKAYQILQIVYSLPCNSRINIKCVTWPTIMCIFTYIPGYSNVGQIHQQGSHKIKPVLKIRTHVQLINKLSVQ